jgi:hypothetical protein
MPLNVEDTLFVFVRPNVSIVGKQLRFYGSGLGKCAGKLAFCIWFLINAIGQMLMALGIGPIVILTESLASLLD